jgi:hypothetical protein
MSNPCWVFVMDASGSMAEIFEDAAEAMVAYADDHVDGEEGDRAALVCFPPADRLLLDLGCYADTADFIRDELKKIAPNGCTPLWDALWNAIEMLKRDRSGEEGTVIVVTDGEDNCSKNFPAGIAGEKVLLEKAKKAGVKVKFIILGLGRDVDDAALGDLATGTGGLYRKVEKTKEGVQKGFREIEAAGRAVEAAAREPVNASPASPMKAQYRLELDDPFRERPFLRIVRCSETRYLNRAGVYFGSTHIPVIPFQGEWSQHFPGSPEPDCGSMARELRKLHRDLYDRLFPPEGRRSLNDAEGEGWCWGEPFVAFVSETEWIERRTGQSGDLPAPETDAEMQERNGLFPWPAVYVDRSSWNRETLLRFGLSIEALKGFTYYSIPRRAALDRRPTIENILFAAAVVRCLNWRTVEALMAEQKVGGLWGVVLRGASEARKVSEASFKSYLDVLAGERMVLGVASNGPIDQDEARRIAIRQIVKACQYLH